MANNEKEHVDTGNYEEELHVKFETSLSIKQLLSLSDLLSAILISGQEATYYEGVSTFEITLEYVRIVVVRYTREKRERIGRGPVVYDSGHVTMNPAIIFPFYIVAKIKEIHEIKGYQNVEIMPYVIESLEDQYSFDYRKSS